jgi:hypothetical protein
MATLTDLYLIRQAKLGPALAELLKDKDTQPLYPPNYSLVFRYLAIYRQGETLCWGTSSLPYYKRIYLPLAEIDLLTLEVIYCPIGLQRISRAAEWEDPCDLS